MNNLTYNLLCKEYNIDKDLIELVESAEASLSDRFKEIDDIT